VKMIVPSKDNLHHINSVNNSDYCIINSNME
jgi:hypothetical protein